MQLSDRIKIICRVESDSYFLVKHPDRQKDLGEVFTPTELVLEMIEQLPDEMLEPGRTFLDPTCGNGQFLAALAIVKRELGHAKVLSTLYGADIMPDNIIECRERLLDICQHTPENVAIVERNIACADGLEYEYDFKKRVTDKQLVKLGIEMEKERIRKENKKMFENVFEEA